MQASDPALRAAHEPLNFLLRERWGEHVAQILARLALLEAQIVRPDLGQLPTSTPSRQRQVRVDPAGKDQMEVSWLMLHPERDAFMDGLLSDHLIIIKDENNGNRIPLAAFHFMEQHCEERGEWWRLGRLKQRYSCFPELRCAP